MSFRFSDIYLVALFLVGLVLGGCQSSQPDAAEKNLAGTMASTRPAIVKPEIPARTVSIVDFGAVGDGKTDNTAAFAKAIDSCSTAGGGHVIVPAGNWFTGPIHLKSRIDFHLDAGATVVFSRKFDDYPLIIGNYEGQQTVMCTSPVSGDGLTDVMISGPGIIDGQGDAWRPVKKTKLTQEQWDALVKSGGVVDVRSNTWDPSDVWIKGPKGLTALRASGKPPRIEDYAKYRDMLRPPLIFLSKCRNQQLEETTFRNSPSWNIHLLYSDEITVHNVTIYNPYYAQNGDGIDIDSCRDVMLTDSNISAGDDVVCLKSGRNAEGRLAGRPTENVTVAHCVLGKGHGGIAIGSEMSGGVRNVEVYDCTMRGTDEALRFKTVRGRGGVVENIYLHDIEMWDISNSCISVDMYYMIRHTPPATRRSGRMATTDPDASQPDAPVAKPLIVTQEPAVKLDEGTPQFRNITIRNILCHGANIAMQLRGLPELPLKDVTVENAEIVSRQGGVIVDADGVTLKNVHIHSQSVPGFQIQDATNLVMEDVSVVLAASK
jgi:polygalacturonase